MTPEPPQNPFPSTDARLAGWRDALAEDGVVFLRGVLGRDALHLAERAFEWSLAHPGPGARDVLAGKPGENEAKWRAAGVDQFVYVGVDVLMELETLHAALGVI